jgi:hypothetical protein
LNPLTVRRCHFYRAIPTTAEGVLASGQNAGSARAVSCPNRQPLSQNAEQATANISEATGYLRDMLSPKKKSFWRWLLELAIPRPTLELK